MTSTISPFTGTMLRSWRDDRRLRTVLATNATTSVVGGMARLVSVADAGWVAFTVVTVAADWYSTSGAILMAAVGALVAVFGVEQAILPRRLRG